jgi:hypothetical protein
MKNKMKNMILALLLLVCNFAFAQTNVYILGSPHQETTKLKKSDFYTAIKNCKPDLILFELDTIMMEKDFSFPKSLKGYFEVDVVDSLIKKNKKIIVRPFDIEGRNEFFRKNKYYETQNAMFTEIFRLKEKDSLTFENNIILDNFIDLNRVVNNFVQSDLKTINSSPVDYLVKVKMNSLYKNFPHLLSTTKNLEKFKEHLDLDAAFWIKRNNEMANHILKFIELYKGKTIVVITGSFHRYYLKEILQPKEKEYNFRIKEFFELN